MRRSYCLKVCVDTFILLTIEFDVAECAKSQQEASADAVLTTRALTTAQAIERYLLFALANKELLEYRTLAEYGDSNSTALIHIQRSTDANNAKVSAGFKEYAHASAVTNVQATRCVYFLGLRFYCHLFFTPCPLVACRLLMFFSSIVSFKSVILCFAFCPYV